MLIICRDLLQKILTEFVDLSVHLRVADQGQERGLDGRDGGREREVRALGVGLALAEAVLEDAVDNTADTEGRLDDVRSELLLLGHARFLREVDHLPRQAVLLLVCGDRDGLSLGDLRSQALLGLVRGLLEEVDHIFLVLFEGLTDDLLVEIGNSLGDRDLLWQAPRGHQLNTSLLHVLSQIEGGSVSVSRNLDPAVARLDLRVPTVIGVMRHLVGSVLAEPYRFGLNSNLGQEEVRAGDEVADSLVADNSALDGVTHPHHHWVPLACILRFSAPEWKLDVSDC